MPKVSQEVFRVRSHSKTIEEAHARRKVLTLEGRAQNITCPLLVVLGSGDRLISPAEEERLAKTASGPAELVVYPERNHVCFNISYKFRPLTADWMVKTLRAEA
jgi:2,6-dihydroxypseudooxynicotine hydrolase